MSMVKHGVQSNLNSVVEVFNDGDVVCEKCNTKLNLLESANGSVPCPKCGHKNKVKEMSNE